MNNTEEPKIDFENLGAIQAEIDYLEDCPPDKRTREFKEYSERLDYLHNLYNQLSDEKVYSTSK